VVLIISIFGKLKHNSLFNYNSRSNNNCSHNNNVVNIWNILVPCCSVDGAGNVSNTTTYGPFIVSNSNVLYVNSTIGGTLYTLFSPSLVQAEAASTTGTTTIVNSSLSVWWDINDSNVINTTFNDAILIMLMQQILQ
jgi:hypothetical protein